MDIRVCCNVHVYVVLYRRGTMDVSTTSLLSIHIATLLPPTSTELDVAHNVQVASVLGIGLVYQATANRHIAEVLLAEIGEFFHLMFSLHYSVAVDYRLQMRWDEESIQL